ncbi:hypothetical protein TNCV_774971 [Trichonephila clavipes]|nr:hypothetical protein TNCV_774971 [Trichonephila clavipes]
MFVFSVVLSVINLFFMDDNAACHRTLANQDCLDIEGIQRLVSPARSPDLNPIENVWDALGGKLLSNLSSNKQNNSSRSTHTVEWIKLPQQLLDNVVQKYGTTMWNVCITLHGGHIPY